jgi:hypothetical protein
MCERKECKLERNAASDASARPPGQGPFGSADIARGLVVHRYEWLVPSRCCSA